MQVCLSALHCGKALFASVIKKPIGEQVMRNIRLGLVLLSLMGVVFSTSAQPVTLVLPPEGGTFRVTGTSSLHDWECRVTNWRGKVTLERPAELASLRATEVIVPVAAIACKNGTMDGKMREALKAETHPEIRFELTRVDSIVAQSSGYRLTVEGRLTIAGTTRPVTLQVSAVPAGEGWRFRGQQALSMKAFGIRPPTAMLGTLRTGDEVVVHFDVLARPATASGL
ncbi:YceI family protein [Rhodothermus bifroesti]|nr:hypothetical protein HRbin18_01083 [bacterium HR18]